MASEPSLEVRAARAGDLPAILRILDTLGYPSSQDLEMERAFAEITSRADMGVLVAVRGAEVLGLLSYSHKPQLRFKGLRSFEIDELGVLPEARGLGIGRLLLKRARELATTLPAKRIVLTTNRLRESYRRSFYTKNGFTEADSAFMRFDL